MNEVKDELEILESSFEKLIKYDETEKYISELMEVYNQDKDYVLENVIFNDYPWDYNYINELIREFGYDEHKILKKIFEEVEFDFFLIENTIEQIYISFDISMGIYKGGIRQFYTFDNGNIMCSVNVIEKNKSDNLFILENENKNLLVNGYYTRFYENGQLREKGFLKEDVNVGFYEKYYQNGQLKEKGYFIDGLKLVLEKHFHSNGECDKNEN